MPVARRWVAFLLWGLTCPLTGLPAQVECGMGPAFRFQAEDRQVQVRSSNDGALLYGGALAINLDGAPNAYHPRGRPAGALDSICNGADAILPDGSRVRGSKDCGKFLEKFNEARDAGWVAPGKPRIEFFGVAVQGSGDLARVPCIQSAGPFAGFFVSQTSLLADPGKPLCDARRYLNSLEVPFFVLPANSEFLRRGMRKGDIAAAIHAPTGQVVFAIFGDTGPANKLGEGSLALALMLRKRPLLPKPVRGQAEKEAMPGGVYMLMFPHSDAGPPYVAGRISEAGQRLLGAWGGEQRLRACLAARE